jgi:protocatechuate 3,4-dioxygenase beta subunit
MTWTPEAGPGGKYTISGTVVDAEGAPVEGAALKIGDDEVWTDAAGAWQVRVKNQKPRPLALAFGDFTAAGRWRVISAPQSASPAGDIRIVVARQL